MNILLAAIVALTNACGMAPVDTHGARVTEREAVICGRKGK